MRNVRFRIFAVAAAIASVAFVSSAQAQAPRSAAQPTAQKCLRALDGSCTNPAIAEATRLRAVIIPSVRVSYFGTAAGSIGGNYIPYERFFQDNEILFGLPTSSCILCGGVVRSK